VLVVKQPSGKLDCLSEPKGEQYTQRKQLQDFDSEQGGDMKMEVEFRHRLLTLLEGVDLEVLKKNAKPDISFKDIVRQLKHLKETESSLMNTESTSYSVVVKLVTDIYKSLNFDADSFHVFIKNLKEQKLEEC
jgi:hypothetical protein